MSGRSETYHIMKMMSATGNQPGVITRWKTLVEEWAYKTHGNADAEAVKSWLPNWQARPFYTAEELAPIWPALAIATGYTSHWPNVVKSAKRLEHELDFYRFPSFELDGRKFYIVERQHYWKNATQEERRNALR